MIYKSVFISVVQHPVQLFKLYLIFFKQKKLVQPLLVNTLAAKCACFPCFLFGTISRTVS